jgi:hypothetical protein
MHPRCIFWGNVIRLTNFTDYGLRVLICLGAHRDAERIKIGALGALFRELDAQTLANLLQPQAKLVRIFRARPIQAG